jgi:Mrp family chromosome partitioning ATPase
MNTYSMRAIGASMNALTRVQPNGRNGRPSRDGRMKDAAADPYAGFLLNWRSTCGSAMQAARTLGAIGASRNEASDVLCANLGISGANQLGLNVLLIDANIQHPSLHEMFAVEAEPGLTDLLLGKCQPPGCVQSTAVAGLSLIASGDPRHHSLADLSLASAQAVLAELEVDFDLIIVDTPPADEIGTSFHFGRELDGALLVVEAEKTGIRAAERARRELARAAVNVLGVVLNNYRSHLPDWIERRLA